MMVLFRRVVGCLSIGVALLFPLSASRSEESQGSPCVNCGGHDDGYGWAEQHGIEDTGNCSGGSQSFIEGCEAYVTEHNDSSNDHPHAPQTDGSSDENSQPSEGQEPAGESAQPSESYEPPPMESPEPASSEPPPASGEQ